AGVAGAELAAVDEQRRRASELELLTLLAIAQNGIRGVLAFEVARKLFEIESGLARQPIAVRPFETSILIFEQQLVHLPKLALLAGSHGRARSGLRVRMDAEGEMLENQAHVVRMLFEQIVDHGARGGTRGTLEVRPLHDGDRRLGGAFGGRIGHSGSLSL